MRAHTSDSRAHTADRTLAHTHTINDRFQNVPFYRGNTYGSMAL